jgi:hypothetical protein
MSCSPKVGSSGTFCALRRSVSFQARCLQSVWLVLSSEYWSSIHMGITRSSLSCEKSTKTLWLGLTVLRLFAAGVIRAFSAYRLSRIRELQVRSAVGDYLLERGALVYDEVGFHLELVHEQSKRVIAYTLGILFFLGLSIDSLFSDVGGYSWDILDQSIGRFLGFLNDGRFMQTRQRYIPWANKFLFLVCLLALKN